MRTIYTVYNIILKELFLQLTSLFPICLDSDVYERIMIINFIRLKVC